MGIRSLALDVAAVDVNHGRGRQRIQFGGNGGHGRREDGGNNQPDSAHREILGHKTQEDVVGVVILLAGIYLAKDLDALLPGRFHGAVGVPQFFCLRAGITDAAVMARLEQALGGLAPLIQGLIISSQRLLVLSAQRIGAGLPSGPLAQEDLLDPGRFRLVEQHRRFFKLVEDEDQRAGEQDEKLQRHFHPGVEHQADPAVGDGFARQVPLHLRLVAPKIREGQEHAADQSRPERVPVARIEGKVHHIELPRHPGQVKRVTEGDLAGEQKDRGQEGPGDSQKDQDHLLHVGPGDGFDPAGNRVGHDDPRHDKHRGALAPSQDHREHHRRRVERQPHAQAALDQKNQAGGQARLGVKALFEKLVSGNDFSFVKVRNDDRRDDDHRQREAEIKLDEAHPVHVGLAGGADKRDGAGLGGHDGKPHRPPGHALVGQQIAADGPAAPALVQTVADDEDQGQDQDNPIGCSHGGN